MSEILLALLTVAAVDLAGAASPGPAFVSLTRTAAARGRGAGLRCALGLATGSSLWAGAAMFGLAAVFAAAPWLTEVLRLGGAAYLAWLALKMWRGAGRPATGEAGRRPFRGAILLQMSNPKTAVFFGSIFVTLVPADPSPLLAAAIVATVFATEVLWFSVLALAFGAAPVRRRFEKARGWIDRICGAAMIALAARLASS